MLRNVTNLSVCNCACKNITVHKRQNSGSLAPGKPGLKSVNLLVVTVKQQAFNPLVTIHICCESQKACYASLISTIDPKLC